MTPILTGSQAFKAAMQECLGATQQQDHSDTTSSCDNKPIIEAHLHCARKERSVNNDESTNHVSASYRGAEVSIPVPPAARIALQTLEDEGFSAWIVGGYVRDALLGRPSNDIDIATRASWHETQEAFCAQGYRTHETGVKHGTVTVIVDDHAFEVTTFRNDGVYHDARHPDSVSFVDSIEEDLARRDFTINALAYHPARGLVDPFGGLADAQQGIIKAVGNAEERFGEDALRILRACRFASELGFSIESATWRAMMQSKQGLSRISAERVSHEMERLLFGDYVATTLVNTVDVLAVVLPELVSMKGFEQRTPYHIYDVLEHTAHVVSNTPPMRLERWAALFHDMGKPASFFTDDEGIGHFYGHARVSMVLARGIMSRLKFSPAFSDRVLTLVEHHDEVLEPTPKAVKRMLRRLGGDVDLFRALCNIKRADALSQAPRCFERVALADELEDELDRILEADEAFSLKALALRGGDVLALGIPRGPIVGCILDAALAEVIEGRLPNEHDALLEFARSHAAS